MNNKQKILQVIKDALDEGIIDIVDIQYLLQQSTNNPYLVITFKE